MKVLCKKGFIRSVHPFLQMVLNFNSANLQTPQEGRIYEVLDCKELLGNTYYLIKGFANYKLFNSKNFEIVYYEEDFSKNKVKIPIYESCLN